MDGTKIEANANKYSFVWKKSTTKYETRLHGKLEKLMPELCSKYGILAETPEDVLRDLEQKSRFRLYTAEASGRANCKRTLSFYRGCSAGTGNMPLPGEVPSRNSFSKTDPDATFMHMKEDHMRNSQLKPGYNIQFGVEGEYITGVLVSSERSDQLTLIPLLEKMESHLGKSYGDITADAGYESEENYTYFEANRQPSATSNPRITNAPKRRNTRATWRSERTCHMMRFWTSIHVRPEKAQGSLCRQEKEQDRL